MIFQDSWFSRSLKTLQFWGSNSCTNQTYNPCISKTITCSNYNLLYFRKTSCPRNCIYPYVFSPADANEPQVPSCCWGPHFAREHKLCKCHFCTLRNGNKTNCIEDLLHDTCYMRFLFSLLLDNSLSFESWCVESHTLANSCCLQYHNLFWCGLFNFGFLDKISWELKSNHDRLCYS